MVGKEIEIVVNCTVDAGNYIVVAVVVDTVDYNHHYYCTVVDYIDVVDCTAHYYTLHHIGVAVGHSVVVDHIVVAAAGHSVAAEGTVNIGHSAGSQLVLRQLAQN